MHDSLYTCIMFVILSCYYIVHVIIMCFVKPCFVSSVRLGISQFYLYKVLRACSCLYAAWCFLSDPRPIKRRPVSACLTCGRSINSLRTRNGSVTPCPLETSSANRWERSPDLHMLYVVCASCFMTNKLDIQINTCLYPITMKSGKVVLFFARMLFLNAHIYD